MSIDIEAQKFLYEVPLKYPHLRVNQQLVDSVVAELKSLGVYREDITAGSFMVGLLAAMESGRLQKPPEQVRVEIREVEAAPKPEPKKPTYAPRSMATAVTNHAHPVQKEITDQESRQLIEKMETSAKLWVERAFRNPPGEKNHSARDAARGEIRQIIEQDRANNRVWAHTARRVEDEVINNRKFGN